jgi:hypothetical protein
VFHTLGSKAVKLSCCWSLLYRKLKANHKERVRLLQSKGCGGSSGVAVSWVGCLLAAAGSITHSHLAVLVPENQHGDTTTHDVDLGSLLLGERQRLLGGTGNATTMQQTKGRRKACGRRRGRSGARRRRRESLGRSRRGPSGRRTRTRTTTAGLLLCINSCGHNIPIKTLPHYTELNSAKPTSRILGSPAKPPSQNFGFPAQPTSRIFGLCATNCSKNSLENLGIR